jgi:glycosyltransferase involved in cell wall biosynthesis
MSDVMPYPSSRFSDLTDKQLAAYRDAWKRHLSQVLQTFRPHVIHSHHVWLMSSLVKDLAPDVPVVTHCHGTGLRQLALCPQLSPAVTAGCARNDAFVALHRGHAETLRTTLGLPADRVHVVGSGFDENVFHAGARPSNNDPMVTYAGKLSRAKGLPWLLEAIAQLTPRVEGLTLHVAGSGSGEEADAIRTRMEEADNVIYHGQLNQSQLADLMRRSAVFVLPSFYEGLPLVLVEAAACGCRIVATSLPGVIDPLKRELGDSLELVPLPRLENTDHPVTDDLPRFVNDLARAIEVSLARPRLEDTRKIVAGMTWNSVCARIETIWQELVTML